MHITSQDQEISGKERIGLKGFLFFSLVLSAFLPYIKTSSLLSDTQPHYMLLLLITLGLYTLMRLKVPVTALMALIAVIYGLLAFVLGASIAETISILFFFLSISFFGIYGVRYIEIFRYAISISVVVYFVFCLVEIIFGRGLIEFLVSNTRTSATRGLTSLTSEPSFLGLVSFTQIIILQIFKGKKYRLFQSMAFLSLLFSASVAVIIPAFVVFMLYFLSEHRLKGSVLLSILGVFSVFLLVSTEGRAYNLLVLIFSDPSALLNDQSVINRVVRSFGPIYTSFRDWFVPHGFDNVSGALLGVGEEMGLTGADEVERLSNVSTYMLFGFGFLSFPIIMLYVFLVIRYRPSLYVMASIVYLLFANVSIAAPYISVLIASPIWLRRNIIS